MRLLVADIGGTNARFAYKEKDDSELKNFAYLKCNDFENIFDAIEYYQQTNNLDIENMSIALASHTTKDAIKFTNNHWRFKQSEVYKYFNLNKLIFINDFVAQCLSLNAFYKDISESKVLNEDLLGKYDLRSIRNGTPTKNSPLLVTGPGTGLGVCTLLNVNNYPIAIEGEGGHSTFAPNSDLEIELLQYLRKKYDHVSNERIVSGSGIEEIYDFICFKNNQPSERLKAPNIGENALKGDTKALETIKLFFSIFGTIISSVILINGTQCGVVIAGGITPKLQSILSESNFNKNFLNKGRRHEYVKNIPIWLTENNNNGLIGASKAINNHHYNSKIITNN